MPRLIGTFVVLGLIGAALWLGLSSERRLAPRRVESVEQLAQMLSERGFGCGYVDRAVPGFPPAGSEFRGCEMGGKSAALYVFEDSPAAMTNRFEPGVEGGWIVGDNYVVTLHDAEVAIEGADVLGAEAPLRPPLAFRPLGERIRND